MIPLFLVGIETDVTSITLGGPRRHGNCHKSAFSNSSYLRLLEYQQDINAMLIMIAGHDHSVAGRIFLESNTDYLLHHVNIPIYVHKEP